MCEEEKEAVHLARAQTSILGIFNLVDEGYRTHTITVIVIALKRSAMREGNLMLANPIHGIEKNHTNKYDLPIGNWIQGRVVHYSDHQNGCGMF